MAKGRKNGEFGFSRVLGLYSRALPCINFFYLLFFPVIFTAMNILNGKF